MFAGLEKVKSHRIWFVPDLVVWGLPGWGQLEFLVCEQVASQHSVLYGAVAIGDADQEVRFEDLVDHRGNSLPSELASPRVLVRSRSDRAAFVVGSESSLSFKIARDPDAPLPVTVDLMVIEMGD